MAWSTSLTSYRPATYAAPQTTRVLKVADLLSPVEIPFKPTGPPSPLDRFNTSSFRPINVITQAARYRADHVTQPQKSAEGDPTAQDWENFLRRDVAGCKSSPQVADASRYHSHSVSLSWDDCGSQASLEQRTDTEPDVAASPHIPSPTPTPTAPIEYDYKLSFRQQPISARACGHGDRDRRVIDPPPILELKIVNKTDGAPCQDSNAMFALHCDLKHAETGRTPLTDCDTRRMSSYMMGASAQSPFIGKDEHGVAGMFFVFSDLSCRLTGRFKLTFTLLRIDLMNLQPRSRHLMVTSKDSDVFVSYTAKEFPGMQASTPLLLRLKDQGLSVSIKKGSSSRMIKRRARSSSADTSFADDAGHNGRVVQQKLASVSTRSAKRQRADHTSAVGYRTTPHFANGIDA